MTDTAFWPWARRDPSRPALVEPGGGEHSFGDLYAESNRLSHALRDLGLSHGDGICFLLPNSRPLITLYLAAMQSGLYLTPVNWHFTAEEIAFILSDSEAKAFFASDRFSNSAAEAAEIAGIPPDGRFSVGEIPGFRALEDLTAGRLNSLPGHRASGQVMFYTSGTTGRPKGVRRTLSGRTPEEATRAALLSIFGIEPGDGVHLVPGPMYHSAPLAWGTAALHMGHTVVLMDKWTPEATLQLIERYRVTETHLVPTMFQRMLALPDEVRSRYDLSSLKKVIHAAAPCPIETKQRMMDWLGPIIWEYYAATEGGGTYVSPQEWLERPGTVGRSWPASEIKILDDDGKDCPPGIPGTIYIRSGRTATFEYYKDREKTEENRTGQFFTVGDIGYVDEGGWLYLCDRKADIIISGGVNIYPAEIEMVLTAHPKVADSCVVGVPDEEWGEQVKAVVQPAPGISASAQLEEELIDYCRSRLANYKCPRSVDFRAELPRYPTGKLYKRLIRDQYWSGRETKI